MPGRGCAFQDLRDPGGGHNRGAQAFALIGFVGLSLLVQLAASGAAERGIAHWYLSLQRPPLTLSTTAFAAIWTVMDILLGVSAWLLWRRIDPWRPSPRPALRLWGWQIALIAAWAPTFFGLRAPAAALFVMVALLGISAATLVAFCRRNRLAGALLLPTLAWLCYAAYLNLGFWWLNPGVG
jgi:tryptophan-rich sensory protein